MKILLSPSKTQNFTDLPPTKAGKELSFPKQTVQLAKIMQHISSKELEKLMHISPTLAELNYHRFQNWTSSYKTQKTTSSGELNFKPAIFAFRGDVYKAFENESYSKSDLTYMEKNLRIISGLYGLMTPLTYLKPYRLEMGTKLKFKVGKQEYKNLYEFWRETLTNHLQTELKKDEPIINLASNEYSKAIDLKTFGDSVVQVYFKVMKNGAAKTIAIFAKRQRGEMANWIIENRIEKFTELKKYKNDGFTYSKSLSKERHLVFLRK